MKDRIKLCRALREEWKKFDLSKNSSSRIGRYSNKNQLKTKYHKLSKNFYVIQLIFYPNSFIFKFAAKFSQFKKKILVVEVSSCYEANRGKLGDVENIETDRS